MPTETDELSRWQMQADEARAVAAGMTDLASKRTMLEISSCYERLAHRAEKRAPKSATLAPLHCQVATVIDPELPHLQF